MHGVAVKETFATVSMRPDLSSKAKALALALATHYPNVKPSMKRLALLTGRSEKTVSRGLAELRDANLLRWEPGKSDRANEYTCLWLAGKADRRRYMREYMRARRADERAL